MKNMTRKIIYGVIALGAIVGIAVLFLPAAVDVDVAPVTTGPMSAHVAGSNWEVHSN